MRAVQVCGLGGSRTLDVTTGNQDNRLVSHDRSQP